MTIHRAYKFRKAGVLDTPFIFELIQEGSLNGFFNEYLMTSKGYIFTLLELFLDMLRPLRRMLRKEDIQILIFTLNDQDIGFIKIQFHLTGEQGICLCAITPPHRNHKHGSQMIRMYLETLPVDTVVIAYCSKYARTMQCVLRKQKFQRDKNSFPAECYRYTKNSETLHASREMPPVVIKGVAKQQSGLRNTPSALTKG